MSSQIVSPPKPPVRLNTKLNPEGQEVEIEIREDEEDKELLQNIFNVLIGAGYFRANFKELSSFDKVAGGMIWCIYTSNQNVNIGLPFGYGEQLNIGKKIFLSENIIKVLLSADMKCPLTLQPHQILGLDVKHILPLMKWLVEQSKKYRKANIDDFRQVALKHFSKFSTAKLGIDTENIDDVYLKNLLVTLKKYLPRRKFARKVPNVSEKSFKFTQHEYIHVTYKNNEFANPLEDRNKHLNQSLVSIWEADLLDDSFEDDIDARRKHYDLLKEEIYTSSLEAEILSANKKKIECENILAVLLEEKNELDTEVGEILAELGNLKIENENVLSEIKDIEKEHLEDRSECKDIERNIEEIKQLREQYSKLFTIHSEKLDKLNQAYSNDTLSQEDENVDHEQVIEELTKTIEELKISLAEENKQILQLETISEEPDGAELAMYQKRFHELYDEVAANTVETKQFFDLYNTLIDTKQYIAKEINLLNSVLDNYQRAMSSANYRGQFFDQLESIVKWVTQTRNKVADKLFEKKELQIKLYKEMVGLQELEREYASVVSQLSMAVTTEAHRIGWFNSPNKDGQVTVVQGPL